MGSVLQVAELNVPSTLTNTGDFYEVLRRKGKKGKNFELDCTSIE